MPRWKTIDAAGKNFWLTIRYLEQMKHECAAVQRSEICTAGWGRHHVAGRIFADEVNGESADAEWVKPRRGVFDSDYDEIGSAGNGRKEYFCAR